MFYHVRTTRDEIAQTRAFRAPRPSVPDPAKRESVDMNGADASKAVTAATPQLATAGNAVQPPSGVASTLSTDPLKHSSEVIEEVFQCLKTAFPLLVISLDSMVENLRGGLKYSAEDEAYHHISMLVNDAIQVIL
jgi:transformation/transcription domain-associated protein